MYGSHLVANTRHSPRMVLCALLLPAFLPVSAMAGSIVAAARSKVYHTHPERCASARNIEQENRVTFASTDEAESEGRRLCKFCAKIDAKQGSQDRPARKEASNPPRRKDADPKPEKKRAEKKDTEQVPDARAKESPVAKRVMHSARVKNVLPGGTLLLETGERVRLAGIVCPSAGQMLAEDAASFLQAQAKGRKVHFEWYLAEEGVPIRDELGRIPAFVSTGSSDSDLAAALLAEGLGWVDWLTPCARRAQYLAREDDAAWAQRGIWKRLDGAAGRADVIVGKHTHEYHAADCPHVVHLTEPVTIMVNEAKGRRLAPCDRWRDDPPKK